MTRTGVLLCVVALLSGCASKPPPASAHAWPLFGNVNGVPMQGLSARPALIFLDAAPELANFDVGSRELLERLAAQNPGAGAGTAVRIAPLLPACAVFPPVCFALMAGGGAWSNRNLPEYSADQARQLGEWFAQNAGTLALAGRMQDGFLQDSRALPAVALSRPSVVLIPAQGGIAFAIGVKAKARTGKNSEWKETAHYVLLPTRAVADWSADNGAFLHADFDRAARILGGSLRQTYLPYELREAYEPGR